MRKDRLIALFLAVVLAAVSFASSLAVTGSSEDTAYNDTLAALQAYLASGQESSATAAAIAETFESLGTYEYSRYLRYYTLALKKIADGDFGFELTTYLDILSLDERFAAFLAEQPGLGSVADLTAYAAGRQKEAEGDRAGAAASYSLCPDFYDAQARIASLMSPEDLEVAYNAAMDLLFDGKYEEAYAAFAALGGYADSDIFMTSIVRQLGYTPGTGSAPAAEPTEAPAEETAVPAPDPVSGLKTVSKTDSSVIITWSSRYTEAVYAVYWRLAGTEDWGDPWYTRDTELQINELEANTEYEFRVVTIVNDVESKAKLLKSVRTASPTPKPTASPTPKPTATPKPARDFSISGSFTFSIGRTTISWTDSENAGPYTVSFQCADGSVSQTKYKAGTANNKSFTFEDLIAGHSYIVTVTDKNDKTASRTISIREPSYFSDGNFRSSSISVAVEPRYMDANSKVQKLSRFVASTMMSNIDSNSRAWQYGLNYKIRFPKLSSSRTYMTQIVIIAPNGYLDTIATGEVTYDFGRSRRTYVWWDCLGTNFFPNMYETLGNIPIGSYTVELYWDGMLANTTSFEIK